MKRTTKAPRARPKDGTIFPVPNQVMTQGSTFRRASRRFEMMVHQGVPESPQPMYQENTYGRTSARLTGQASDAPGTRQPEGEIAAIFLLRAGDVVSE
jgi:hypothetical protein